MPPPDLCPAPGAEPCPTENLEDLVRCIVSRLADDLGRDEALRLVPALVRAVAGAVSEASDRRVREALVQAGRRLAGLGLLPGAAGNLSVRDTPDTLLITPAGARKGELRPDDLVRLDMRGNVLGPPRTPSSEFRVHLLAYQRRPDVQAVVHAHSPFATGFAVAGVALDRPVLAEAFATLGPAVPLVPYGQPSTWELAERLEPWIANHHAFLLANHGVLTLGSTLAEALHRLEVLEFLARVVLTARLLGGERLLSEEDLKRLAAGRVQEAT